MKTREDPDVLLTRIIEALRPDGAECTIEEAEARVQAAMLFCAILCKHGNGLDEMTGDDVNDLTNAGIKAMNQWIEDYKGRN